MSHEIVMLDAEAGEIARVKLGAKLPADVPPIPEGTLCWQGDYADGVHTVFDSEGPHRRWRFDGHGKFSNFVEYGFQTWKVPKVKGRRERTESGFRSVQWIPGNCAEPPRIVPLDPPPQERLTAMHPHRAEARKQLTKRIRQISGDDDAKDRRMVMRGIREHEDAMHGGKHTKLKLARGGRARRADGGDCEVEGKAAGGRLDRASGHTKRIHRQAGGMMPGAAPGAMPGGQQLTPQQIQQAQQMRAQQGAMPAAQGIPGAKSGGRTKRADGGRLDRAMGGRGKKGARGPTTNVIVAPGAGAGGGGGRPVPVPVPVSRPAPMAGRPPMPPGAGMPPGGGMPPRPMGAPPPGVAGMGGAPMPGAGMPPGAMGMRKSGGRTREHARR